MTAKLQFSNKSPIPAGFFGNGLEAFWHDGEKWVIAYGVVQRFDESNSSIQQPIFRAFMADKQSLAYMAQHMGIKKLTETFETWYRCVVGGLDNVPDIANDRLTPDAFNNTCTNTNCPHRGKLCSRGTGINNRDIETISQLKQGKNMEQVATAIHLSVAGVKSRMLKLHEKLQVTNTVALVARATEMGI
jgi:DNA-binding CsgD family transcriptional regulator